MSFFNSGPKRRVRGVAPLSFGDLNSDTSSRAHGTSVGIRGRQFRAQCIPYAPHVRLCHPPGGVIGDCLEFHVS